MKLKLSKRKIFVVAAGAFVAVVLLIRWKTDQSRGVASAVEAVGLRGTSRTSKPMSPQQRERFEAHFLATPAVPVRGDASTLPDSVHQAQSINVFNSRQNQ